MNRSDIKVLRNNTSIGLKVKMRNEEDICLYNKCIVCFYIAFQQLSVRNLSDENKINFRQNNIGI